MDKFEKRFTENAGMKVTKWAEDNRELEAIVHNSQTRFRLASDAHITSRKPPLYRIENNYFLAHERSWYSEVRLTTVFNTESVICANQKGQEQRQYYIRALKV